ncbi:DUF4336 domain-containing protein [Bowmanella dokdonensis]|uniref:DUF4336 domain-containing protein n=2 Tax=Bowmanella dokdonensis TaxID=751969 RepID=A0A939DSA0_9ALTE|nr:DUF4336 domain-containing protein [Bowmanella dokdonensis]
MTIVEVEPRVLWIHSPLLPNRELQQKIDDLGSVRYLVAPNKIHSLGVQPWRERYPLAEVWVSPEFNERHPEIHAENSLLQNVNPQWADEIDYMCFEGSSFLDEVVFFHKRSRTLILTDLIQRHEAERESWFWRIVKRAGGVLGASGGTAYDLRFSFKNKEAAKASALSVLEWDFDRVVISHGMCITEDAHPYVEKAFEWAIK